MAVRKALAMWLCAGLAAGSAMAQSSDEPYGDPTVSIPMGLIDNPSEVQYWADLAGLLMRTGSPIGDDSAYLLQFEDGMPVYKGTDNVEAARTVSTNTLWTGGSSGYDLCSCGIVLGIWEIDGVRTTHQELSGRVDQKDAPAAMGDHATHVAGTMIASGVQANAQGMSFSGALTAYDANNDFAEMQTEASTKDMRVSNHSYSTRYGWQFETMKNGTQSWVWRRGDGNNQDPGFGQYNNVARQYDEVTNANQRYLPCVSASNQRRVGPNPGDLYWVEVFNPMNGKNEWKRKPWAAGSPPKNPDFDSIPASNTAKNVLTVGDVNQIAAGYKNVGDVTLQENSGCGPTDDGRIKPDICAGGVDVVSSVAFDPVTKAAADDKYDTYTGTSMATPTVSGSLGLVLDYWRHHTSFPKDPLSSTLRALVIHTADEAGPADGPDYTFGWGLLNTLHLVQQIARSDDTGYYGIKELTLLSEEGSEWETTVYTDDFDTEFKVTIAWNDPAGAAAAPGDLNVRDARLVNDLDLRVFDMATNQEYKPWVLDWTNPGAAATHGDNTRDNVEQVVVKDIETDCHHAWRVVVTHKGPLVGDQVFSVILSGAYQKVVTPCLVDWDGDGFVDFFDFYGFVDAFEQGLPSADAKGDCFIEFQDFFTYVDQFENGCPPQ